MHWRSWIAGLLAGVIVVGAGLAADLAEDPYLWLEDIHGAKALAWAEEQNASAFKRLKSDSDYAKNYDAVLGVLDATDRIPMGQAYVSHVFNFWQDETHVRGIWRRTPISSYETQTPQWETLIDIDELARSEGKNWVFKRASCSLDLKRCLISLSLGGGDTVVLREFDPVAKRFMPDGFDLGESKAEAAYLDADTILFSTDFGKGTLTESGYPRIVKIWHRGERIADAKIVYQGTTADVVVSPVVFQLPSGPIALAARSIDYYETEYYSVITGQAVKLPLPESADVKAAIGDQLIATLRKEWVQDDGTTLSQGSLIAFPLKQFLETRQPQRAVAIYSPGPRATIDDVA